MGTAFQFIKTNLLGILIACAVVAFIYEGLLTKSDFTITQIIGVCIVITINYGRRKEDIANRDKLRAKGLTLQDTLNIAFVKQWEKTRQAGIWKYCVQDGGMVAGCVCAIFIGVFFAIVFKSMFKSILESPASMFVFIGYTYIIGVIIGVCSFRVLWSCKEKRFLRLTDPMHMLLSSVKDQQE